MCNLFVDSLALTGGLVHTCVGVISWLRSRQCYFIPPTSCAPPKQYSNLPCQCEQNNDSHSRWGLVGGGRGGDGKVGWGRLWRRAPEIKKNNHTNNTTKQLNQKQISALYLIFNHLTVVSVLFCSLKKGLTPKIRMLCFVIIMSVPFITFYVFGSRKNIDI